MLPVYNKALLSGIDGIAWLPAPFNWPLATSALQLAGASLCCGLVLLVQQVKRLACSCASSSATSSRSRRQRLGRVAAENVTARFLTLLRHVTLPAIVFAAVIALSNVGLAAVGVNLHVLLRSSEVFRFRRRVARKRVKSSSAMRFSFCSLSRS